MELFEVIYKKARLRESMTGAIMELCKLIKRPNPEHIMKLVGKVHSKDAAEEAAHELTENNPEEYNNVLNIIMEETVNADELERRYLALVGK
jgi:hypothetical protein